MTKIDFLEENLRLARFNLIRAERAYLAAKEDSDPHQFILIEEMGIAFRSYVLAERYVKHPSDFPTPFQIALF